MLEPETYKKWVDVSWPGSYYEGNWKQGQHIKFLATSGGGTVAMIQELRTYEFLLANHVAVINKDGTENRDSDVARGWIGTTESYSFTESNGKTEVKVEINTNPAWEKMFNDGWPDALAKLKELTEG